MPIRTRRALEPRRIAADLTTLLPAVLTLYFSFSGGGFFAGSPAVAATALALVLALRVALADRPFSSFGPWLSAAVGAMALYTAWTLLSALWSNAPARALIESDRALLYLLVLVLLGSLAPSRRGFLVMTGGLAAAMSAISVLALITRVLPDVWPVSPGFDQALLSYPLTYSNGLGLVAATAIVLLIYLTTTDDVPKATRVLAAGAVPAVAATLLLTFSRGAIAALAIALLVFVSLGRPRGLAAGLLATVPTASVAVIAAYQADLLAAVHPSSPAAVAQGHNVALIVTGCVLAAVLIRAAALRAAARSRAHVATRGSRARARIALGALLLAVAIGGGVAGSGYLSGHLIESRANPTNPTSNAIHNRLTTATAHGRVDYWRGAVQAFRAEPLLGQGAGTYALWWAQHRPTSLVATDAHSLYLEALGELGIVGFGLIVGVVLLLLAGLVLRARGPARPLFAALAAAGLAWALHAGTDWDWELPAVTSWMFAVGGAALASPCVRGRPPRAPTRAAVVLGCVLLTVMPLRVALSQSALNDSAAAFARRDCAVTSEHALDSISVLDVRPEPYALLGYCDLESGKSRLAVARMRDAERLDPENWELHYGLALALASAGHDPRPAAREALMLNPREPLTNELVARFAHADRRSWPRLAHNAPVPF